MDKVKDKESQEVKVPESVNPNFDLRNTRLNEQRRKGRTNPLSRRVRPR